MEIYLVGGAVRDTLLNLPVTERDWVVVGATPEQMLALDFQPVGKEFPVFLHPESHEEYALARTERKVAKGYKGFTFYAAADVTLEDDLKRRDLTINAIAQDQQGNLIDPYNGQQDLQQHILRHVSGAFAEDPVRILRIARFAARFTNFSIHPSTNQLMRQMVDNGEVNALVAERVWQEFAKALTYAQPTRFFSVLHECHALATLFPEINIKGAGIKALTIAEFSKQTPEVKFATLFCQINPHNAYSLCDRIRAPKDYRDLAILVAKHFNDYRNIRADEAEHVLKLLKTGDGLRRRERFQQFLFACEACLQAVTDDTHHPQTDIVLNALDATQTVDITPLQEQNLKGEQFAKELHQLQVAAITETLMKSH